MPLARLHHDSGFKITQGRPTASAVAMTHGKLTAVLAALQRFAPICHALFGLLSLLGHGAIVATRCVASVHGA
jgi:hypothetical protein